MSRGKPRRGGDKSARRLGRIRDESDSSAPLSNVTFVFVSVIVLRAVNRTWPEPMPKVPEIESVPPLVVSDGGGGRHARVGRLNTAVLFAILASMGRKQSVFDRFLH